ncbi:PREDICTED: uncharacterized protein LOC109340441 [Lupinus angustifolius]|uniref:uncharacterized protein LOC109340441 n=1 Tax=Lupinus angustifolius TaxID=3871 RepID=UPI00092E9093|nr:PREDICTED: uncharacterized protein LOC109340441 [Lupinus angustifolius]
MGWGGVLRDHDGRWISGISGSGNDGCPLLAELLAIQHGLQHAWQLGYRRIDCETDYLEVVELINGDLNVCNHWYIDIILSIRGMWLWHWDLSLTHISRDSNMVADALAREASEGGVIHRIWRFPHSSVIHILCLDLLV